MEFMKLNVAPVKKNSGLNNTEKLAESNEKNRIEKLLEFRFNQYTTSRLAEYITGLRPYDPKMGERLVNDQKIIRAKYGLPDRGVLFHTPAEYEHFLLGVADKLETKIRKEDECGSFFKDYSVSGVFFDGSSGDPQNVVGIDIEKSKDLDSYTRSLNVLEHELIHANQNKESPNMPIELMEYEAYVAGLNMHRFKDDPENIESLLFGFFIYGSVAHNYRSKDKISGGTGEDVKFPWDNPEFFLKNIDKIDDAVIEEYKNRVNKKINQNV